MSFSRRLFSFLFIFFCLSAGKALAADYYWIGGTGNWTDLTHWATTSGGNITYNQIPTAEDDVFFDANSFSASGQTVTLNAATALVHSISSAGVTNSPVLQGPYVNMLKIYGSLNLTTGMSVNFLGAVDFEAINATNTISMGGDSLKGPITFNSSNGGWTLEADLITQGSITLNSGVFNSNNYQVKGSDFSSTGNLARTLNMGSSQFNFSGAGMVWYIDGSGIVVNPGTSAINLSGTVIPYFLGGSHVFYDLNFTGTGTNVNGAILDNDRFHNVNFASSGSITTDTFANLTFQQNGTFNTSSVCQNLFLSAGYSYQITAGTTQTITGSLNATGSCGSYINIYSSVEGSQASINHPATALTGAFLILKDINATGSGSLTASNSIDLGDNTGCTISAAAMSNLYWVGNSGNWSDGNHWSLTSGGPPSGCSPTPMTNVFFDANSFSSPGQSVVLNVPTAYCGSMDWTGALNAPSFSGNASNGLKIYGSLTFIPAMTVTYNNSTNFEATSTGNTITSAGKKFSGSVYFNGVGGAYTLLDSLTTLQTLTLNAGSLNSNSNTMTIGQFYSPGGSIRSLSLGASTINITGNSSCWTAVAAGLTLNAGTSTINVKSSSYANYFEGGSLQYYDLNFTDTTAFAQSFIEGTNIFHNVSFSNNGSIASNTFQNLIFQRNGTITGNNSIVNLTLTGGYVYSLTGNSNQTISGNIIANGQCNSLINISSNTAGMQAILTKNAGTVNADYLVLKDVQATGGAVFNASSSVDLGDNTGWNFTNITGRNLYWIGNAGNWSDGNHWSLTSGGTALGCSPSPLDNVFFDANSFSLASQTVNIDVPIAYCANMTWTGATGTPLLNGTATKRLKIFGSLSFITQMAFPFAGYVDFQSAASGNTITTASQVFLNSVYFVGVGGAWTLQDSLTSNEYIYLNNGTLNTNSKKVNAYGFYSESSQSRTLNMGASILQFSAVGVFWQVTADSLTLNSDSSTIIATNWIVPSFYGGGMKYYDLIFAGQNSGQSGYLGDNNSFHNVTFHLAGIVQGSNTFNQLSFLNNGTLLLNNTFNNLLLTAQYTYAFGAGNTQTILNRLQAQGTCTSYLILNSTVVGSTAFVNKAAGNVLGFNIHMRDISATGGATFFAYNSVNLGNNTGWDFTVLPTLLPPEPIIGPATVCAGSDQVVYHTSPVSGAIFYQWTVPTGATIEEGQGDTTISVNFGTASSGNVSVQTYNGCDYNTTGSSLTTVIQPALPPSVTLASATNGKVCAGNSIVFTTTVSNVGNNSITYNFKVNGVSAQNSSASSFVLTSPANNDQVTCDILTSGSTACSAVNSASSDTVQVTVTTSSATPAVTLSSSATGPVCSGTPVTFTATASNTGGGTVTYNFNVNGISAQNSSASSFVLTSPANNDQVTCNILISGSTACSAVNSASSDTVQVTVAAGSATPAVALSSNATGPVCSGTPVTFTATASNTGSGTVTYNFKVNGVSAQNSSASSFVLTNPANNDQVTCNILTSGSTACSALNSASSDTVQITVAAGSATPAVTLSSSAAGPVCSGTPVTFTATASNTGGGTVTYNFKENGNSVQNTNQNTYTSSTQSNGDMITCQINIASGNCLLYDTAVSETITSTILTNDTPSVSIAASTQSICPGTPVNFTASVSNAGPSAVYQWYINGLSEGSNTSSFSSSGLVNGDTVSCSVTSNAACTFNAPVLSNNIVMQVNSAPPASISISASANNVCAGEEITFTATTQNAGNNPAYQWKVNEMNVGSNAAVFQSTGLTDNDTVICELAATGGCSVSTTISNELVMAVLPNPTVTISPSEIDLLYGKDVQLSVNASGTVASYLWTPSGSLDNASIYNPTASPKEDVVYTIKVTGENGCTAYDSVLVRVLKGLSIPNSFTPNGDGINDVFRIPPHSALVNLQYFAVYNRYGQRVFETQDISKGWDGTVKGVYQPAGNYIYEIKATGINGTVLLKGSVLLIR